jgi:hypothetical protein
MTKFKVELQDKDGNVLLTHNLFAKNEADVNAKLPTLLDNVRDKRVCKANVVN